MSFQDFLIISPEIVISFTAILVFLLDLFINDKKILVPVSISGLVISFILTLGLWNGWLIESPGIYAFFSSIKLLLKVAKPALSVEDPDYAKSWLDGEGYKEALGE